MKMPEEVSGFSVAVTAVDRPLAFVADARALAARSSTMS